MGWSGKGVDCAPAPGVWGHGVSWASSPPTPSQNLCTIHGKSPQPWGQPSPSPAPSQGSHPPQRHCCKNHQTDFGSAPTPGWANPRVLPKDLEFSVLGSGAAAELGSGLDSGTALSTGWVGTGAQRRDQEGTRGGLWQLCAAPGSCTTGASLQWPFKPDWKMLCTARLTKKRHFPSCGSSSGCLMSLNGWGGIAQHPRKAKQLNPCALLWKIRGIYNV